MFKKLSDYLLATVFEKLSTNEKVDFLTETLLNIFHSFTFNNKVTIVIPHG